MTLHSGWQDRTLCARSPDQTWRVFWVTDMWIDYLRGLRRFGSCARGRRGAVIVHGASAYVHVRSREGRKEGGGRGD